MSAFTNDRSYTRGLGLYKPNINEDAEDTDWGERLNLNSDLIDDAITTLQSRAEAQDATLGAVLQSLAFVRQQNEQLMQRLEELHERMNAAPAPAPAPVVVAQPDGRAEIARVGAMLGLPPPEPLSRSEVRAVRAQEAPPPAEVFNVTTPNFGFNMPEVGGDSNIWGGLLNDNAMTLDGLFLNYLGLGGGRLTGPLALPPGAVNNVALSFGSVGSNSGFYGSGASTMVASIGTQVMLWSLSGTTSFAALNMNNNRITNVGTPTQDGDAVNRGYLNGIVGNYLPLSGGQLSGQLVVPDGAQLSPSLAIGAADDGTGFWRTGNFIVLSLQGQLSAAFTSTLTQFYAPVNMLNNKIQTLADATAATDALNLRTGDARYLRLSGGQMSGAIEVLPPQNPQDAASKNYVDTTIAGLSLFMSTWQVAANTPDISGGAPSPGDYYIAVTAVATTPETAPANIPGIGGQVVNNGDVVIWDAVGAVFELVRGGPLTVAEANALYIQKSGDTMAGPLVLAADGTTPMEAVTLQQLQAVAGSELPEAPVDGLVYGRQGSTTSWQPTLPLVGGQIDGNLTIDAPNNGPGGYGNNITLDTPLRYGAIHFRSDGSTAEYYSICQWIGLRFFAVSTGGETTNMFTASTNNGMQFFVPGTFMGSNTLTLAVDATAPMQAVTLQQLQAGYLSLSGGTMQGTLTLATDPGGPMDAATRQFVESVTGGIPEAPGGPNIYARQGSPTNAWLAALPLTGGQLTGSLTIDPGALRVGTGGSTNNSILMNSAPLATGLAQIAPSGTGNLGLRIAIPTTATLDLQSQNVWVGTTTSARVVFNVGTTPQACDIDLGATADKRVRFFQGAASNAGNLRWALRSMAAGGSLSFSLTAYDNAGANPIDALAADRSSGLITVANDPTAPLGIATKQYVDAAIGGIGGNYLPIVGGVLQGALGVSTPLPANRSPSLAMASNFAVPLYGAFSFNAYFDAVLADWAYYGTGVAATIGQAATDGTIVISVSPSGAANTPTVPGGYATLDRFGTFSASGALSTAGNVTAGVSVYAPAIISSSGRVMAMSSDFPTVSVQAYGTPYMGMFTSLDTPNAIQWGPVDANGGPIGRWMIIDQAIIGHSVPTVSYCADYGATPIMWGNWEAFNVPAYAWKPTGPEWAVSSDARIKDILGEYEQGLEAVLALKPMRFKLKDNWRDAGDTNPSVFAGGQSRRAVKIGPNAAVAKLDREYIGLIGQDAAPVMPEMFSRRAAIIDDEAVDDLLVMDRSPLLLAVVNAIKEIDARLRAGGL